MPNLSRAVTKISTGTISGIDELHRLEDNLYKISDNLPKDINKLAEYDANTILVDLLTGYLDYVKRELPDKEKNTASHPVGYILKTNDGYKINLYGNNLWYYEFGTGDVGERSKYPLPSVRRKKGYEYNAGPKVIHANTFDPYSENDDPDIPTIYKRIVRKHPEMAQYNWWVSPHGLSNGIPAGMVLFNTYSSYMDGLESNSSSKWALNKNNLTYYIRNELLDGLKGR